MCDAVLEEANAQGENVELADSKIESEANEAICMNEAILIGVAWVKILRGPNSGPARILAQGDIQKQIIKI